MKVPFPAALKEFASMDLHMNVEVKSMTENLANEQQWCCDCQCSKTTHHGNKKADGKSTELNPCSFEDMDFRQIFNTELANIQFAKESRYEELGETKRIKDSSQIAENIRSSHKGVAVIKKKKSCIYSEVGCAFKSNGEKTLEEHLRDDVVLHLECVLKMTQKLAKWQASELQMQSRIYETLLAFCHKHVKLEQKNRDLEQRLDVLHKLFDQKSTFGELEFRPSSGAYYWRIHDFSHLVTDAIFKSGKDVYSRSFYTKADGYCMCLRMSLQPTLNLSDVGVGLFVHIVKGNYDDFLVWPFRGTIQISVVDQNRSPKLRVPITEFAVADSNLQAFQRSTNCERNPHGFGYKQFVTTCILQSGSYLQNDTLLVKCEVTSH